MNSIPVPELAHLPKYMVFDLQAPLKELSRPSLGLSDQAIKELVNQAADYMSNQWTQYHDLLQDNFRPMLISEMVPGFKQKTTTADQQVVVEKAFASLYEGLREEFLRQRVDLLVSQVGEFPYVFDHLRGYAVVLRYASDNLPPHPL